MKHSNTFQVFSVALMSLWLYIFSFFPFCLMFLVSLLSHDDQHLICLPFTLLNYLLLNNNIYLKILEKSILISGCCTLLCLMIGYPFAYIIARIIHPRKPFLLLLLMIPLWTSSLIRSYALIALLKTKGLLNGLLLTLHIIDHPLAILFTNTAVIIGLVYNLLPFMILPIMTNIERLDHRFIDAARDLGANGFTTFRRIIVPLTMPGIIAGCILVFLPAMSIFYIPDILGGARSLLLGNVIQNQFLISENWPLGAAMSIVLTALLAAFLYCYWRVTRTVQENWL